MHCIDGPIGYAKRFCAVLNVLGAALLLEPDAVGYLTDLIFR